MRSLKKALKLLYWSLLIVLASLGIGLSGGVAIPVFRRRVENSITIEMVEFKDEQPEANSVEKLK